MDRRMNVFLYAVGKKSERKGREGGIRSGRDGKKGERVYIQGGGFRTISKKN